MNQYLTSTQLSFKDLQNTLTEAFRICQPLFSSPNSNGSLLQMAGVMQLIHTIDNHNSKYHIFHHNKPHLFTQDSCNMAYQHEFYRIQNLPP